MKNTAATNKLPVLQNVMRASVSAVCGLPCQIRGQDRQVYIVDVCVTRSEYTARKKEKWLLSYKLEWVTEAKQQCLLWAKDTPCWRAKSGTRPASESSCKNFLTLAKACFQTDGDITYAQKKCTKDKEFGHVSRNHYNFLLQIDTEAVCNKQRSCTHPWNKC